jgi:peptidoglycan/xylan/chitin deacetylase (PgdA/CDA1 family)
MSAVELLLPHNTPRNSGARLPVLFYHHIGMPTVHTEATRLTVRPYQFERHLRLLRWLGCNTITAAQWLGWRKCGTVLPNKPILLTFDDAYAETAQFAFPLLEKYGFIGCVFAITGFVLSGKCWEGLPVMSMDDIRAWAARGIEIGAHTRTHPDLSTVDDLAVEFEAKGSKEDLIKAGLNPISFAYPYGIVDDRIRAIIAKHFEIAFTCDEGLNDIHSDLMLMRRTNVQSCDTPIDIALRARLGWSPLQNVAAKVRFRSRLRGLLRCLRQAEL